MSKPGDKYLRTISGRKTITLPDGRQEVMRVEVQVDIYDVINAWRVTDPALQHALKKLIQPGQRGHKTPAQDLKEAIYSIERCLENTRPETVLLSDTLNIVAPVMPVAPSFPGPQGMPNTTAAAKLPEAGTEPRIPSLTVGSTVNDKDVYLKGKLIATGTRVIRSVSKRNDNDWKSFCIRHGISQDALLTVACIVPDAGRLSLTLMPNRLWDAVNFSVV